MAKLTTAIKPNAAPAVAAATILGTSEEIAKQAAKCKAWTEKCKTTTTCPHCSKVHPNRTHSAPHALSTPRVFTAVIDKLIGVSTLTEKHETLQRHTKQLNDIVKQRQKYAQTQSRTHTHVTDLEHAMHIMEQHTSSEMANKIFDKESGKYLKYWQLLAHPN